MVADADDYPSMACHPDRRVFEDALKGMRPALSVGSDGSYQMLGDVLGSLHRSELSSIELSDRASILLKSSTIPPAGLAGLATLARSLRGELKAVILDFLPPSLKRHVYATTTAPPPVPTAQAPSPDPVVVPILGENDRPAAKIVLLLGNGQEHEANQAALLEKNFTPLRVRNLEELGRFLHADICGIVVAGSWWATLPSDQHEDLLKRLIGHSTFAMVKVDVTGLNSQIDIEGMCHSLRFRKPSAFEMAFHSGCDVHLHDIRWLQKASDRLSCSGRVRMRPADIDEPKAQVLAGATSIQVESRHLADGSFRMESMATAIMPGGRSTALVVRIDPDDGGPALVAKIDKLEILSGEMSRFHKFIAWSDPQVAPTLHFHAGTALIAFNLVDCPEHPGSSAPTLEESIDVLMSQEVWTPGEAIRAAENLAEAIDRSIEKLSRLNARSCTDSETESWAWLGLEAFDQEALGGPTWSLTDFDGREIPLGSIRSRAWSLIQARSRAATVHGDVHLRNILVRDGREPCFIDYAHSGPGHPAFDLARLESSLLYRGLRMTADESRVAALLLRILDGCDSVSDLQREFHQLMGTPVNRLVVLACIRCRAAAMKLVDQYGGSEDDYLAVRLVIACQGLFIPHLQTGVVRASIVALAARIGDRWDGIDIPRAAEVWRAPNKTRALSPL